VYVNLGAGTGKDHGSSKAYGREIAAAIAAKLPVIDQHSEIVEQASDEELQVRAPFRSEYLGADAWLNSSEAAYSGPLRLATSPLSSSPPGPSGRSMSSTASGAANRARDAEDHLHGGSALTMAGAFAS
jgi:hypothetical protein